jgi:hypothetical protein
MALLIAYTEVEFARKSHIAGWRTHMALADWQAPGFLVSSADPAGYL